MNRGEEMIVTARSDLSDLRKLGHGPYTRRDIAKIIDTLGSRLETFLKTVALPMSSSRQKLVQLIDQLKRIGLPAAAADNLHALRIFYNISKHVPAEPLLLTNAIVTVQNAISALEAICALRIGATGAEFGPELTYHLWVGFWDHYTGGMTNIAVMLPGEHWTHVSTVDVLQMNIQEWDLLKPILGSHPRFRMGREHFEPAVWKNLRDEDDFLNAGVWEGEYSELIRLLGPFQDPHIQAGLLPGLKRVENTVSVGTALIMAAVDVVRDAKAAISSTALQESILSRASEEYALTPINDRIRDGARQIADAIITIPVDRWHLTAGPVLVNRDAQTKLAVDGPLPLSLDGDALVLRVY